MKSLKVILNPCKSPGILSIKLWIREGSRADPFKKKGIHYLLSTLLTRGCGPYNSTTIADVVEGNGAVLLSETYEDGIMISMKCMTKSSSYLLPILKWMIIEPLIEVNHMNLERKLLIQTINRNKENSFHIAFNQWKKISYGNHPYSHDILGVSEDLKGITREDLLELSKMLRSRKKVLVASGSLPNNILDEFSNISKDSLSTNKNYSNNYIKPLIKKSSNNDSIIYNFENTGQIIILLGTTTIPHSHENDLILRLLNCHLGIGMSSVLFKMLREKNGLAYDVGIYHPIREYEAPFLIHASTTKEKGLTTLKILIECWLNTLKNKISHDELELAKAKYRGNMAHNSQTISQKADRKAHLLGINMYEDHDINSLLKINQITREDIIEIANLYLKSPKISLSGPQSSIEKLKEYWINYFINNKTSIY
ncbi:M16 family metallopeptidase [Prochlorococcus marinus]|uniref:M16 family metallopeptidase n=1 Tax=Prochlorococcus marinus TaxID=1219 RepID=UPI0022B2E3B2|nr:pitrilysin family protein [Prochlorococcus marinus]